MGQRALVVAVSGLKVEARIASRGEDVRALAGGGDAKRLAISIEQVIAEDARGLISFGVAGGLVPGLPAGACLIGGEVLHEGTCYTADPAWTAHLERALDGAKCLAVAGVDHPLRSRADKRALNKQTGAAAADMESHLVAEAATRHHLPFAVLRVIADPAEREIPHAAIAGMRGDGTVSLSGVVSALLQSPRDLPGLLALAGDMRRALAALLRCHHRLGPRLGFGDLG